MQLACPFYDWQLHGCKVHHRTCAGLHQPRIKDQQLYFEVLDEVRPLANLLNKTS